MSLNTIINYLYDDEEKNWQEENRPACHIFCDILRVTEWFRDYTPTPN